MSGELLYNDHAVKFDQLVYVRAEGYNRKRVFRIIAPVLARMKKPLYPVSHIVPSTKSIVRNSDRIRAAEAMAASIPKLEQSRKAISTRHGSEENPDNVHVQMRYSMGGGSFGWVYDVQIDRAIIAYNHGIPSAVPIRAAVKCMYLNASWCKKSVSKPSINGYEIKMKNVAEMRGQVLNKEREMTEPLYIVKDSRGLKLHEIHSGYERIRKTIINRENNGKIVGPLTIVKSHRPTEKKISQIISAIARDHKEILGGRIASMFAWDRNYRETLLAPGREAYFAYLATSFVTSRQCPFFTLLYDAVPQIDFVRKRKVGDSKHRKYEQMWDKTKLLPGQDMCSNSMAVLTFEPGDANMTYVLEKLNAQSSKVLPIHVIRGIIQQVAMSLAIMDEKNIEHNDMATRNVFLKRVDSGTDWHIEMPVYSTSDTDHRATIVSPAIVLGEKREMEGLDYYRLCENMAKTEVFEDFNRVSPVKITPNVLYMAKATAHDTRTPEQLLEAARKTRPKRKGRVDKDGWMIMVGDMGFCRYRGDEKDTVILETTRRNRLDKGTSKPVCSSKTQLACFIWSCIRWSKGLKIAQEMPLSSKGITPDDTSELDESDKKTESETKDTKSSVLVTMEEWLSRIYNIAVMSGNDEKTYLAKFSRLRDRSVPLITSADMSVLLSVPECEDLDWLKKIHVNIAQSKKTRFSIWDYILKTRADSYEAGIREELVHYGGIDTTEDGEDDGRSGKSFIEDDLSSSDGESLRSDDLSSAGSSDSGYSTHTLRFLHGYTKDDVEYLLSDETHIPSLAQLFALKSMTDHRESDSTEHYSFFNENVPPSWIDPQYLPGGSSSTI